MKKNIGKVDRWIRIVAGVLLLALLVFDQSGWRWVGLLGIVALVTALLGYCPLYTLLGINTAKKD